MKVFVGLAVFSMSSFDGYVLTTFEGKMPVYQLDDDSKPSLELASELLSNILGYSSSWPVQITQSGTYEFPLAETETGQKEFVITYLAYFPAIPSIDKQFCKSYKWVKLKDLSDDRFNSILRHVAIQRF